MHPIMYLSTYALMYACMHACVHLCMNVYVRMYFFTCVYNMHTDIIITVEGKGKNRE